MLFSGFQEKRKEVKTCSGGSKEAQKYSSVRHSFHLLMAPILPNWSTYTLIIYQYRRKLQISIQEILLNRI